MRFAVRVASLVVAVLVVVGVAMTLAARPKLADARDAVEQTWTAVRPALDDRYTVLATVNNAVANSGAPQQELTNTTERALARWRSLASRTTPDAPATANQLEGLARRLLAAIGASDRLQSDQSVTRARRAFAATTVPESGRAYNRAVDDYEQRRTALSRRIVARVLGYDAWPVLDVPRRSG